MVNMYRNGIKTAAASFVSHAAEDSSDESSDNDDQLMSIPCLQSDLHAKGISYYDMLRIHLTNPVKMTTNMSITCLQSDLRA